MSEFREFVDHPAMEEGVTYTRRHPVGLSSLLIYVQLMSCATPYHASFANPILLQCVA